jgi:hypothetical protein
LAAQLKKSEIDQVGRDHQEGRRLSRLMMDRAVARFGELRSGGISGRDLLAELASSRRRICDD